MYNDDRRVKHFLPISFLIVHPLRTYIDATGLLFDRDDYSTEEKRRKERYVLCLNEEQELTCEKNKKKRKRKKKKKAFGYCYYYISCYS